MKRVCCAGSPQLGRRLNSAPEHADSSCLHHLGTPRSHSAPRRVYQLLLQTCRRSNRANVRTCFRTVQSCAPAFEQPCGPGFEFRASCFRTWTRGGTTGRIARDRWRSWRRRMRQRRRRRTRRKTQRKLSPLRGDALQRRGGGGCLWSASS